MTSKASTQELAEAIYTVNRHAKTAPEPQHLYHLKKEAIHRLLEDDKAKKIGMHFSDHPKLSNQHSTLLIQVADYYFHILPSKEDFEQYEHLGSLDHSYRNPRSKMPLGRAKHILYDYIGWKAEKKQKRVHNKQ
ncbi:MAG TPA: YkyB family protein, partial [Bacillota bacterium]|nr:YkyB family protein [Bacillota bacterium]